MTDPLESINNIIVSIKEKTKRLEFSAQESSVDNITELTNKIKLAQIPPIPPL